MMELFLNEKIEMEEEMAKLKAKTASDNHFITHLEEESVKSKSSNMKLENKMRKMSISYEESTFTHAFNRDNFEAEHQAETIEEMGKEIANLKGKLSKEKERRYLLEDQLVHLEEAAGINNVKAATYEGETEMLVKKQSRSLKKIEDLNNRLQRMSEEKIGL